MRCLDLRKNPFRSSGFRQRRTGLNTTESGDKQSEWLHQSERHSSRAVYPPLTQGIGEQGGIVETDQYNSTASTLRLGTR